MDHAASTEGKPKSDLLNKRFVGHPKFHRNSG